MLALERRFGRELFSRLLCGNELTEQGQRLLEKIAGLEQDIPPVLSVSEAARPGVKISAGHWVTHVLCQKAAELADQAAVALRFIAADQVPDIGRREAVIGIMNARPVQADLAGRSIGRVQFAVYASDPVIETWARVLGKTPSAR